MRIIRETGTICMIIPLLVLLFSCASAPYTQTDKGVLKLVDLINEGQVTEVEGLAQVPFALDTETLYLESDVATYWNNLHEAGFTMTGPRVESVEHVSENSWQAFADSYDMKNFFARYTGEDTSLVTLKTGEGTFYLLLERKLRGYPRIRGIKGPIQ
ncbi:MAG TPA: hypothetical protein PLP41_00920 [Treponemataceae bacterium]|nr:hypothetical protein [Treponemataceae bacterium]HOS36565.1 hypothetical protein [Treponemataceae bacterium]